jgi:predicted solute-binding protein
MESVRIGVVRYLNTAPLIEGLDRVSGLTIVPAVPAGLADMLRSGAVDIALASIVDLAGGSGGLGAVPLTVLPVGMIGCDGPTLTVRVFSQGPLEAVREIHADVESHTSVVLCRLLFKRLFGREVSIVPYRPQAGRPGAVLLIGDKVVTDVAATARYSHHLDLGEAWHQATGLPFVYAAWACRSAEAGDARIQGAAALLDRQRRHNRTRLDWIVAARAEAAGWPRDLAANYLGSLLRYDLGAREREAADLFITEAASHGYLGEGRSGARLTWNGGG